MINTLDYIIENKINIIGYSGFLGKGKTLSAITLTYFLAKYFDKDIVTNTPLKFNNFKITNTVYYDDLKDVHDSIILLDEVHRIADSRETKKKENLFSGDVLTDIRKFNSILILTAPKFHTIEKRIRDIIEVGIKPKLLNNSFNCKFEVIDITELIEFNDLANLEPFINLYDTHYKPHKLKWRDE